MATIPGSLLILCASKPLRAHAGALFDAHRRWYGPDAPPGSPLVWHATTREMNPTVPQSLIDAAMERDLSSARAEYYAEFRTDLEMLLTREAVRACVVPGCREMPPLGRPNYLAFCDPSGGARDSMTSGIAHRERNAQRDRQRACVRPASPQETTIGPIVLDAIREVRPPFSPEVYGCRVCVARPIYGLRKVTGDRYGGEWPREQFTHPV